MGKLEERENRRKSVVGSMIERNDSPSAAGAGGRGRPKESRELKKRISLSVLPSIYEGIQKIAYVERKSVSELVEEMMEDYQKRHSDKLEEFRQLKCETKN